MKLRAVFKTTGWRLEFKGILFLVKLILDESFALLISFVSMFNLCLGFKVEYYSFLIRESKGM